MDERGLDLTGPSSVLLVAGDIDPVAVENTHGASPLLLLGDHAGRAIPTRLGDLGIRPDDRARHIAWDIGVAGLGRRLSERLDAVFVHQRYSRLVIDCNRAPGQDGSIATVSDGTPVPANQGLGPDEADARRREVFQPYQDRIATVLAARRAEGRPTLLVSLHSFTPVMDGFARPWRFGVLHRNDSAFSRRTIEALRARWGGEIGDNQPYAMDGIDFTIPFHADTHGLDYLELEVRQDLIGDEVGQAEVADALAGVLAATGAAVLDSGNASFA